MDINLLVNNVQYEFSYLNRRLSMLVAAKSLFSFKNKPIFNLMVPHMGGD